MIYKKTLLSIAYASAEIEKKDLQDRNQKSQRLREYEYGLEDDAITAEARKVME
jgi:hypothetical protein